MAEENKDKKEQPADDFEFNPVSGEFEYSPGPVVDMDALIKEDEEKKKDAPPEFDYIPPAKKDEVMISQDAKEGEEAQPKNLDEMFKKDPRKAMDEIDKKMRFFKGQKIE